jgi:hypothetical protein
MAYQSSREYELLNPPTDGISGLAFNIQGLLLVSSWDTVRELFLQRALTVVDTKICKVRETL